MLKAIEEMGHKIFTDEDEWAKFNTKTNSSRGAATIATKSREDSFSLGKEGNIATPRAKERFGPITTIILKAGGKSGRRIMCKSQIEFEICTILW